MTKIHRSATTPAELMLTGRLVQTIPSTSVTGSALDPAESTVQVPERAMKAESCAENGASRTRASWKRITAFDPSRAKLGVGVGAGVGAAAGVAGVGSAPACVHATTASPRPRSAPRTKGRARGASRGERGITGAVYPRRTWKVRLAMNVS